MPAKNEIVQIILIQKTENNVSALREHALAKLCGNARLPVGI
jgi:hypothetical protein